MARRQQRANSARGQLLIANRRVASDRLWSIAGISGNTATIRPLGVSGEASLVAVPQMLLTPGDALPVTAGFSGTDIVLTYGIAVTQGLTLTLPPMDPGWRTNSGEFLAAGGLDTPTQPTVTTGMIADGGIMVSQVNVFDAVVVSGTAQVPAGPVLGQQVTLAVPTAAGGPVDIIPNGGGASLFTVPAGAVKAIAWDGAAWV